MTQPFRLPSGGVIDRNTTLRFRYDGRDYEGFAGDTLASALIANGIHLVARSFKYHRPRGIVSAGCEEPNALVQLAHDGYGEPNARATQVELYDGLEAASQNCWPSVRHDIGSITDRLARFFPVGFYYKTFMWPPTPSGWRFYEHWIRRAAGMGKSADAEDPDRYAHRYAHCDVLVIGAGRAGLAAALAAAESGARVIVCDENAAFGGNLRGANCTIDDLPAADWIANAERALASHADVTLLPRTTAFGYYDQNLLGLVQRVTDHLGASLAHVPRQRLWHVRAKRVVLASGAFERGIAYANNDLPGTMLADSARIYVERYAAQPGKRAVVFTNHDRAYNAALALHRAGVEIAAIVDARNENALHGEAPQRARVNGLSIMSGSVVVGAHGRLRVEAVEVAASAGGDTRRIACDLVCISGGFNPAMSLYSQSPGTLRYNETMATFIPDRSPQAIEVVGAANGVLNLGALEPLWSVPPRHKRAKCFIDWQNDVTTADVALAAREGYTSVEHLKRYTTLGMGTDQGKTSNIVGLALLARALNRSIPEVGTTTFRPPYTPLTLGTIAGAEAGPHLEPTRYSALHEWHVARGARFVTAGLWLRPHSYPRNGESGDDAANREALNVRTHVGVVDVSTLGKIELQGRDVAEFLNRVYINRWDTLAIGRCRYGVMLREDGIVLDDGTTSRLGATHYLMTTTTVNAVRVMQHLERLLQVEWPDLDVFVTSVTEQWCAAALSGPKARDVLARVVDIDVSNSAFPFLAVAQCHVRTREGSVPARVFRMSYSGELAFEVHVPGDRGVPMWEALIAAGNEFGITPYGTEAMSTLRIEKGHIVVGAEADGRTTADDLGLGKLVSMAKWCIGKPLLARAGLNDADRWQLVGLTTLDSNVAIPRGAKLVSDPDATTPVPMQGHVTSWCWSPNLETWIALALLSSGRARHGESIWAVSPLANARAQVRVGPLCFIDPDGERLRV
ncbi:MAG TPA: 2Fe-2S iron-sulfur cluster-binding protein [Casimicrobiaceae bacterium]|nr:2Fe-2S iron-sulfur cluster-binding protein [Casimicrobiaceae bacterium]